MENIITYFKKSFLIFLLIAFLVGNVQALRLPYVPKERWVEIDGEVRYESALKIMIKLQELDQTPGDIRLRIFSPGGECTAGLGIIDIIKTLKNDVQIMVCGDASSMAMYILAVGTKGKRAVTEHTEIFIHQIEAVSIIPFIVPRGAPQEPVWNEERWWEKRKKEKLRRSIQYKFDAILFENTDVTPKELAEWDNTYIYSEGIIGYKIADGIYRGEKDE